jgi:hypothetical protein
VAAVLTVLTVLTPQSCSACPADDGRALVAFASHTTSV